MINKENQKSEMTKEHKASREWRDEIEKKRENWKVKGRVNSTATLQSKTKEQNNINNVNHFFKHI